MHGQVPPIGLRSPGESPINKKHISPESQATSLFNSPNQVSPVLGFGERMEVASVIKTDSH